VYGGDTALHIAAATHHRELAESLVARGAEVRARNRRGAEPIHYAADGSPGAAHWDPVAQRDVVTYLIEAGADPNIEYALRPDVLAVSRATPLEAAVLARRPEIVQLLMHEGAAVDERGWHHLYCIAADIGEDDVIEAIDAYRPSTVAAASCTR